MKSLKEGFERRIGTSSKNAFVCSLLVASTLIWGFTLVSKIAGVEENEVAFVRTTTLIAIVVSAVLGTLIFRVRKRVLFLKCWMVGGVLVALIPVVLGFSGFLPSIVFFTFVGVYFGLGLPVCFGYFTASTEVENRSRLGGLIFLVSVLGIFLLSSVHFSQAALNSLTIAIFETLVLVVTIFVKPHEQEISIDNSLGYRQIFHNRSFLLYLAPWIMFTVVDFLALPLVRTILPEYFLIIELSGTLLAGILASVFGFVADRIGRKRLVLIGFALLGVGYGILSLSQVSGLGLWSWGFFAVVDGFAWGTFCTIFIMTIWGDLANGKSSEKYYAIGFLPFLLSAVLPHSGTIISAMVLPTAVFSFASIFLFVAVLPLAYAPETLNLKRQEFMNYVDKAMKKRICLETEI